MSTPHDHRLGRTIRRLRDRLLDERGSDGRWVGRLSSSALSTATAAGAMAVASRARGQAPEGSFARALDWLAAHQNPDGGWGDTVRSRSNLSTTLLVWSALGLEGVPEARRPTVARAEAFIAGRAGDTTPEAISRALLAYYGNDRTFSAPILTMAALSGRLGEGREAWRGIPALPFELAACPHRWLKWLRLPVVSYALPALIAIGQSKHHFDPPGCPLLRVGRRLLKRRTLSVLRRIQPASGGFLEASPLTCFVAMNLAGSGRPDHPVVCNALRFVKDSTRPDGSLPIDTDLATWVTTLSVIALSEGARADENAGPVFMAAERERLRDWILDCQHRRVHPFTNADPGGWSWTDLSGGVPDADDTAGALLALRHLGPDDPRVRAAAAAGAGWLLDLQNADGGIPTFCRGWGTLPFDRSAPDLTAHALRAWGAWLGDFPEPLARRVCRALPRAVAYMAGSQRPDGSWVPLWFGNEWAEGEQNPTYGTARTVTALSALGSVVGGSVGAMVRRGAGWLVAAQGADGGWGGDAGVDPSIEETALAVEALAPLGSAEARESARRGVAWLVGRTDEGRALEAAPIGLYFARLWYFERLYPVIFALGALKKAAGAGLSSEAARS